MVSEKITKKMIESICKSMKYYDLHRRLPGNKVRVNIMLSNDALDKIGKKNRSFYIERLILGD